MGIEESMKPTGKPQSPDLQVSLGPLTLKNPLMAASGTFGYGEEYDGIFPAKKLGAIITKGLSLKPRQGNPPPRIAETPSGMLNAIGLENVGLNVFLKEKFPILKKIGCPVLVNIFGHTMEEFVELADRLSSVDGIAGLELNISCPNLKAGGSIFAAEPRTVHEVVAKVRRATRAFLMVKLSPNVADIAPLALAAQEAGADAVSLINTLIGMSIQIETRTPRLGNITGGLSGPAIRPIGVRMVWQVAQAVQIPVVGIGGIVTAQDALEYIIAGATAVQVGTAHFLDPKASLKIIDGIRDYLIRHHLSSLRPLIGSLRTGKD